METLIIINMSSILADCRYTLQEFQIFSKAANTVDIDPQTIEKINYLSQKVGAPTYKKTPDFRTKHHQGYKKQKKESTPSTVEDWEAVRNFKATKLSKNTEGIEVKIDKIRSNLNRLTKKTYSEVLKNIIAILNMIMNDEETKQELNTDLVKVGNSIFEIGAKNKFWSELYASLYNDLVKSFPIMRTICIKNFEHFEKLFQNIEYVSPEKNYDQYCVINKTNEERKGMSNFLIYLMNNNLIEYKKMCKLITHLFALIDSFITQEDKKNHIEEISENLHLLIVNGKEKLEKTDEWKNIVEKVYVITLLKPRDYKSLTQKTIFKMMDINEEL